MQGFRFVHWLETNAWGTCSHFSEEGHSHTIYNCTVQGSISLCSIQWDAKGTCRGAFGNQDMKKYISVSDHLVGRVFDYWFIPGRMCHCAASLRSKENGLLGEQKFNSNWGYAFWQNVYSSCIRLVARSNQFHLSCPSQRDSKFDSVQVNRPEQQKEPSKLVSIRVSHHSSYKCSVYLPVFLVKLRSILATV